MIPQEAQGGPSKRVGPALPGGIWPRRALAPEPCAGGGAGGWTGAGLLAPGRQVQRQSAVTVAGVGVRGVLVHVDVVLFRLLFFVSRLLRRPVAG
jgi:hypothetical protein